MKKHLGAPALIATAALLAATTAASSTRAGTAATRASSTAYTGTIAFLRGNEDDGLYLIAADGSGLRRVTPPGVSVQAYAWSPNRRLLAYIDARWDSLWLVRPDGTGLRRLLRASRLTTEGLSWSPDGRKIAINSKGPFGKWETCTIYVVPIHGSSPRELGATDSSCGAPAWSPRGDEIAYDGSGLSGSLSGGMWLVHPDGSGSRQVSRLGGGPVWSSDGKQLAFNVHRPGGPGNFFGSFAVVDANGEHYHVVTRHAYSEFGEVWSPRRRWILYGRADLGGIDVIDADGTHDLHVTDDSPPQALWPALAWSPDGSSIVYHASTGGLYEVGVNGRGKLQLTSPADNDIAPSWVVGDAVAVPSVIHLRLDRAERTLTRHHLGFKGHGDGSGLPLPVRAKHNYEVCAQSPRSGKRVSRRTRVALYLCRPDNARSLEAEGERFELSIRLTTDNGFRAPALLAWLGDTGRLRDSTRDSPSLPNVRTLRRKPQTSS